MTQPRDTDKRDRPEPSQGEERDFGDSAGYGSGGSTLDRHDVGDVDPAEEGRPNPLDQVIKPASER
jgi:hypothetical protein